MKYSLYIILILIISFCACQNNTKHVVDTIPSKGDTLTVTYAKGFEIINYEGFKLLTVKSPWPNSKKHFTYALVNDTTKLKETLNVDQIVKLPIKDIVVTSTTHIPSLEMLDEANSLIGFPNLDYISSKHTRSLIAQGKIKELGANESINTEVLLDLQPDVVVGFAIDGKNKTLNTIRQNGIPVIMNGDWLESDPLGKAEWIKVFGALYNKEEQAENLFNAIVKDYLETKELAKKATRQPSVLSGSLYKDIWYLPYGNSWQAQFIKDANGKYVYDYTKGKGSISITLEKVLEKGKTAEIWIAPGSFTTYNDMKKQTTHYVQFDAFKTKSIFTFAGVKGETGGILFYELGPNRPDLILKDLVKSFHPELLPNYNPTFLKPLR